MKKKYTYTAAVLVFAIIFSCSCNKDRRTAENLYKEREYLLKEFKGKSVISRGGIFYQLSYYKGQSVNKFYFEKIKGVLLFTNDTIQYPVNEIAALTSVNITDSLNYRRALSIELNRLLKAMHAFKIKHVSAEERYAGIDMKIYFGEYKVLLYVTNVTEIKNERWKNYVASGNKLDDNWYYVKEE